MGGQVAKGWRWVLLRVSHDGKGVWLEFGLGLGLI